MIVLPNLAKLTLIENEPTGPKVTLKDEKAKARKANRATPMPPKPKPDFGRVPVREYRTQRAKIVFPNNIAFNLIFNNCVNFTERIFRGLATCETIVPGVSDPRSCRVLDGISRKQAFIVPYSQQDYLTQLFAATAPDSWAPGFETIKLMVSHYPEMDFNAYMVQISHKTFKIRNKYDIKANAERYIAYTRGHMMVGLVFNKRLVQDPNNPRRMILIPSEPWTFIFGAGPDDHRIYDADGKPEVPIRGRGWLQTMMMYNLLQVNTPDMIGDIVGPNAKKDLSFKVGALYRHADESTHNLRLVLTQVLTEMLASPLLPYPANFDNSDYAPFTPCIPQADDDDPRPVRLRQPPEVKAMNRKGSAGATVQAALLEDQELPGF